MQCAAPACPSAQRCRARRCPLVGRPRLVSLLSPCALFAAPVCPQARRRVRRAQQVELRCWRRGTLCRLGIEHGGEQATLAHTPGAATCSASGVQAGCCSAPAGRRPPKAPAWRPAWARPPRSRPPAPPRPRPPQGRRPPLRRRRRWPARAPAQPHDANVWARPRTQTDEAR